MRDAHPAKQASVGKEIEASHWGVLVCEAGFPLNVSLVNGFNVFSAAQRPWPDSGTQCVTHQL